MFRMKLDAYIRSKNLTRAAFAEANGFSRQAVASWCCDPPTRIPRPQQLAKIAEATAGAVTYRDFFEAIPHVAIGNPPEVAAE